MTYYIITILLFLLASYAKYKKKYHLHPLLYCLYGITACLLGLFYTSHINILFSMRYFLYVISGFVAGFIPFLFFLIIMLILIQLTRSRDHLFENLIIIIMLSFFIVALLWIVTHNNQKQWVFVITSLMYITMYYIFLFSSFIVLTIISVFISFNTKPMTLIVLGQEVEQRRMTPNLILRLKHALKQKDVNYILTGGLNDKGDQSEATYMQEFLLNAGIKQHKIYLEERSRNTKTNFQYSKVLIDENKLEGPYQIITSFSHVFRAKLYAWQAGIESSISPSKESIWSFPYHFVREFIATIILSRYLNLFAIILVLIRVYFEMRGYNW